MPDSRRLPSPVLAVIAALLFGAETAILHTPFVSRFDLAVILAVRSFQSPAMTAVLKAFTFVGSGVSVAVLAICLAIMLSRAFGFKRELVLMIGAVAGGGIANYILKALVNRARPDTHRLIDITGLSFPSGHAMTAMTFYGFLIYVLYRHARTLGARSLIVGGGAVMIAIIGVSRIYLGVHYPSDVIGGFVAGAAWLFLCIWLYGLWDKPAARTAATKGQPGRGGGGLV